MLIIALAICNAFGILIARHVPRLVQAKPQQQHLPSNSSQGLSISIRRRRRLFVVSC